MSWDAYFWSNYNISWKTDLSDLMSFDWYRYFILCPELFLTSNQGSGASVPFQQWSYLNVIFFFFLLFNVISVNSEYFKMLLEGSPMVQGVTSELWSFQFKTPGFRTLHFSEAFSDLRVKLKTKTITMIFFPHFLKSLVIYTEKNPI